ncbi:hypothetical protein EI94DRAFT_1635262 [Lactarius quietus]|nr:hypothetical protein EI94DRAFT_1635262 [Lactarius quietus]
MQDKRSTCHDHRAVNNVNKHGGHLESTGIGATACIHGAFVPDSVALNFNMEGIQAALISYDVMCQWSVHMMDRVNGSAYLKLPNNLKLKLVIGLFHIHGHQDTCLARYSPRMSTSHRREVIDDHMNDSN